MPSYPRPKNKLEQLARKIMGKPAADIDTRTWKQRKVQAELRQQEIRYVRD
jgi:hypothetical protein